MPVKIRSSCDNCLRVKVRCGHERPACGRCLSHCISCQYSPSRRVGRPRDRRNKTGTEDARNNGGENDGCLTSPRGRSSDSQSRPQSAVADEASISVRVPSSSKRTSDFGQSCSSIERIAPSPRGRSQGGDEESEQLWNSLNLITSNVMIDANQMSPDDFMLSDYTDNFSFAFAELNETNERHLAQQTAPNPRPEVDFVGQTFAGVLDDLMLSNCIAAPRISPSTQTLPELNISLPPPSSISGERSTLRPRRVCDCSTSLLQDLTRLFQYQLHRSGSPITFTALKESKEALNRCSKILECSKCAPLPSTVLIVCQTIEKIVDVLRSAQVQIIPGSEFGGACNQFESQAAYGMHSSEISRTSDRGNHSPGSSINVMREVQTLRFGNYLVQDADRQSLICKLFARRLLQATSIMTTLKKTTGSTDSDSLYMKICAGVTAECSRRITLETEKTKLWL